MRSTSKEWVIVTDVGTFPMPEDMIPRFEAVKKRKDGRIDRRSFEGKVLLMWERMFREQKLLEWKNGA